MRMISQRIELSFVNPKYICSNSPYIFYSPHILLHRRCFNSPTTEPSPRPTIAASSSPSTTPTSDPSSRYAWFMFLKMPDEKMLSIASVLTLLLQSNFFLNSPTDQPSVSPSQNPSPSPSVVDSQSPSYLPSQVPSLSFFPTAEPSFTPTSSPTTPVSFAFSLLKLSSLLITVPS